MKRVGIFLREWESNQNNYLYAIRNDLISFLRQFNIEVVAIPISYENNESEELKRVEKLIKICDGIILPGGSKIHNIDLKIVEYLYEQNIPTLGICLGMQMMALAFNGKITHLPNLNHQSKEEYVHKIKLKSNSKLANILKSNEILVNSRHEEHIIKTDLKQVAIAPDLTLEAIEDDTKIFFIGVQWHPESLKNDIYSQKLFSEFINCLSK